MSDEVRVSKVVIPAAGAGTRWHPWTLAMPKEMVPVGTQPGIAYVVNEAIASGCSQVVVIANAHKNAIADYFEKVTTAAHFTYIPQPKPLGVGHAILMARAAIHQEFFGVILPDELLFGAQPGLAQLITIAQCYRASVIAVREVPYSAVSAYGVVAIKRDLAPDLFEVSGLVEKPAVAQAPSNMALIGRYVLCPAIFDSLNVIGPGAKGEIQLTDALAHLLSRGERVLAYKIEGERYDIGVPLGWTQAVIGLALQNPNQRTELLNFIAQQVDRSSIRPARAVRDGVHFQE